jgi:hypothetical protein
MLTGLEISYRVAGQVQGESWPMPASSHSLTLAD